MTTPHLISALEQLDDDLDVDAAPPRRQPGRLVELFVEGEQPYTVRVANRETIAYEKTLARHKEWPALEHGQHFAMTFMVWTAAKRDGRTSLTFEAWQDALIDWEIVQDRPADPTR